MTLAAAADYSPSAVVTSPRADLRAVRIWLWSVATLVFLMVIVGGATRLTESGLSITEWKPITGVLPPLSDAAWLVEFEKYKQIPQYAQMFPNMELAQFKSIFFWEWGHRLLGRVIGLAFALPLAWFVIRRQVSAKLGWQLAGILLLGGLQGFVGWWMVKSGLSDRVEVAPERLATHLLLASLTFVSLVMMAVGLNPQARPKADFGTRATGVVLLVLVLAQIACGALVAGSRAGWTYNTWPLMDGHFVPPVDHLLKLQPVWLNFLENITTVQFDHRMLAYTVMAFAGLHLWQVWRTRAAQPTGVVARAGTVLGLVSSQAAIGIMTLLLVVPLWAGLLHQAFAMVVLAMASVHARLLFGR